MDGNRPTIALGDANRAMVLLVLGNLLAWLAGVPLLLFFVQRDPEWLKYALLGAALAPCLVLFFYFVRVFLWTLVFSFWYALGCAASLWLMAFAFAAGLVLTGRVTLTALRNGPPARIDELLVVSALAVLLVLGAGMFVVLRWPRKRQTMKLEDTPLPVVEHDEPPKAKPLTYLEHRVPRP